MLGPRWQPQASNAPLIEHIGAFYLPSILFGGLAAVAAGSPELIEQPFAAGPAPGGPFSGPKYVEQASRFGFSDRLLGPKHLGIRHANVAGTNEVRI
jgi:hypothetical protein